MSDQVIQGDELNIAGAVKSAAGYNALSQGLATGAGIVSSILSANSANKAAAKQAKAQMDFQERMSNTAHQREVADLVSAGLNPALSATGGSGSSTPSGAMAEVKPVVNEATAGMIANSARNVASFAADMKQKEANVSNTNADTDLKIANKLKSDAETNLTPYQRNQLVANTSLLNEKLNTELTTQALQSAQRLQNVANATNINLESSRRLSELPALKQEYKFREDYNEYMLPADAVLNRTGQVINQINNAKDIFMPKLKIESTHDVRENYKSKSNRIGF